MSEVDRTTLRGRMPVGVSLVGGETPNGEHVLTPDALNFVRMLEREFGGRRKSVLRERSSRQVAFNAGHLPDFLPETRHIREAYWRVKAPPAQLLDRRVELIGPTEPQSLVDGLNARASVFVADFEDSHVPSWRNMVEGQHNVYEAIRGRLAYATESGRAQALQGNVARLMIRPRGLHLVERHMLVDEQPVSAALFDFGLFAFHNAKYLLDAGTGVFIYIPKIESHREALLWNDVIMMTEDMLDIPRGSIRVSILIETITAAFEMHEILYALREHAVGLNCGRWDYIFSMIKKFHRQREYILPDRSRLSMMSRFLRSFSLLLVQTAHKRGAHAIGGIAAQFPVDGDEQLNAEQLLMIRLDKEREVEDGHDGSSIAHPRLVELTRSVFDNKMSGPNQLHRIRDDVSIEREDLLEVPKGDITEQGLRSNISASLQYLAAWLGGRGLMLMGNHLELASTAEVSRSLVWQWVHHGNVRMSDGRVVSANLVRSIMSQEYARMRKDRPAGSAAGEHLDLASAILRGLILDSSFQDFMTIKAYEHLDQFESTG